MWACYCECMHTQYRCCNLKETYGRGFCLSPFFFYFFTWMAVAHIHTSIQKEAFTRSPGFMIINIILRTITLTLMSRHSHHDGGSSYIYQAWATTSFLSPFSFYLSFFETHPLWFSFSLKLKTHHLLLYTMWPDVSSVHLRITNSGFKLQCIWTKSPLAHFSFQF